MDLPKKYKDWQAVVTTSEYNVMLQQPVAVTSTKTKANPQVLKVASGRKGIGPIGKWKGAKSLTKGKGNVAKPPMSKTAMSASPSANLRDKAKDCPVVTVTRRTS